MYGCGFRVLGFGTVEACTSCQVSAARFVAGESTFGRRDNLAVEVRDLTASAPLAPTEVPH